MVVTSELFSDPQVFGTVLHAGLLERYGTAIYVWDPKSLWLEIEDDFGVELEREVKDRIQCMIALMTTNAPWILWESFEVTCHCLNRTSTPFEILTPSSPEEIAWCVRELYLNKPDEGPWSEEVKGYIRRVLYDSGYYSVPEILAFTDLNRRARSPRVEALPDISVEEVQAEQRIREIRIEAYVDFMASELEKQLHDYLAKDLVVPRIKSSRVELTESPV